MTVFERINEKGDRIYVEYDETTHCLHGVTGEGGVLLSVEVVPIVSAAVPQSVTRKQGRVILEREGLLDTMEGIISSLPRIAQIEYQDSVTFRRDNALLEYVAHSAGKTDAEIDQMFIDASKIVDVPLP